MSTLKKIGDDDKPEYSYQEREGAFQDCGIEKLDFPNGLRTIGYCSFKECKKLTSILFPDEIEKIGEDAFKGDISIEKLFFPSKLKDIGRSAFSGCTGVTEAVLSNSVRTIRGSAFYGCTNLQNIFLNEGLTSIGSYAFCCCNNLQKILIPNSVMSFGTDVFSRKIGTFNRSSNNTPVTIVCFPGSRAVEYARLNNLIVESAVVDVSSQNSFDFTSVQPIVHKPITKLTSSPATALDNDDYEVKGYGSGVIISKYIGFDEADTVIPNEINGQKVIGIGENAFKACKGIVRLAIPEGIEFISNGAFSGCTQLKEVIFPSTLKKIGDDDKPEYSYQEREGAFQDCGIEKLDFPNGLRTIGYCSFKECKKLTSILFPDEIEKIGEDTFKGDISIEKLFFPSKLKDIGRSAFFGCTGVTEAVLSNSVRTIRSSAFCGCTNLQYVFLNEGLTSIGSYAFSGCNNLKSIEIPASVSNFGGDIFKRERNYGINSSVASITIKCKAGSKAIEYARLNNLNVERV